MSTEVKEAVFKFTADTSGLKTGAQQAKKALDDVSDAADGAKKQSDGAFSDLSKDISSGLLKNLESIAKQLGSMGQSLASLTSSAQQNSSALSGLAEKMGSMGQNLTSLTSSAQQNSSVLSGLAEKLETVGTGVVKANTGLKSNGTAAKGAAAEIAALEKKLSAAKDKLATFQSLGLPDGYNDFSKLTVEIQEMEAQLKNLKGSDAMREFGDDLTVSNQRIVDVVTELRELEAEQKQFKSIGKTLGYEEFENNESLIRELTAEVKEYQQQVSQPVTANISVSDNLTAQLKQAKAELAGMEASGLGLGDAEYDTQYQEVVRLTDAVKDYKTQLAQREPESSASSAIQTLGNIGKTALNGIASASKTALTGLTKMGGTVGAFALKATGLSGIAEKVKSIGSGARSSTGGVEGLVRSIRNVGVVALGLKLTSSLFGQLRSAVSSYVSSNEALSSSVERLKNGLGQALAPAINVVINAVSRLLPYIIGIADAIASLITNIFGKGWTSVSTGVSSAAGDAAGAVDSVKDATEGAAKAQEEYNRTIAGFDEITKLDDNSSSGGSGGGGGSGSPSGASTSTTDGGEGIAGILPEWLSNLIGDIQDLISAQNWYGIGNRIAQELNGAMGVVDDWINNTFRPMGVLWAGRIAEVLNGLVDGFDWAKLGTTIADGMNALNDIENTFLTKFNFEHLGTGIATAFNGFVDSIDAELWGTKIANKVNAVIDTAHGLVNTVDWSDIGTKLSTAVNSAFGGIDWSKAGTTLSDGVKGLLTTLSNTLKTLDWRSIATNIESFVTSIDYAGVVRGIAESLGALAGGLTAVIGTWIADAFNGIGRYFDQKTEEAGGNIVLGILKGILDGILGIGQWIVDNVFTPFIDGFKSAFGINSPSTVMAEQGGYLIEGLLQGITDVWDSITGFFSEAWESIQETVSEAWDGIKETASSAWDTVTDTVSTAASGVYKTVKDKFKNTASTVSEKVSNVKKTVSTGFTNARSTVTTTAAGIYSTVNSKFSSMGSTISSKVGSAKSAISTGFTNARSSVTTATAGIYSTASSKFNSVKSSISSASSSIYSTVSSKFTNVKTKMTSTFASLKSSASSWGKDICSNLASGINGAVSKVTSAASSLAGKISSYLHFSEPDVGPLSNFHTYMPDMLSLMAKGIKDNTNVALGAVSDLADAIAGEMQLGDITAGTPLLTRAAVVPTGSNTSWMDSLADKVARKVSGGGSGGNQPITVYVTLDGKVVGKSVVNYAIGEAKATGQLPWAAYT